MGDHGLSDAPTLWSDSTRIGPLAPSDAPAIVALEDEAIRRTFSLDKPTSLGLAAERISRAHEAWRVGARWWWFAIRPRSSDELLGEVRLVRRRDGLVALELWIGRPYRRHGHAVQAAQLALRYAFEEQREDCVRAEILDSSRGARRLAERLGFADRLRAQWPSGAEGWHYRLWRRDWRAARRSP